MPEYLLELYVARADALAVEQDAARVRRAAEEYSREGTPVRYLRSIFVPDDETCFLIFEAPSAEAVREVARRASVSFEHVAAAIESAS
jgi:Nickel responsive protein SCO4226-like